MFVLLLAALLAVAAPTPPQCMTAADVAAIEAEMQRAAAETAGHAFPHGVPDESSWLVATLCPPPATPAPR